MTLQQRYDAIYQTLRDNDQLHLIRFWDDIDEEEQKILLDQLENIDYPHTKLLYTKKPVTITYDDITPLPITDKANITDEAKKKGKDAIKKGKLALFIVAGGQGSRLGFDGPKGCYPLSPVKQKTIFQLLAEHIKAKQELYKTTIELYIMTSETNHEPTQTFFKENKYFGLNKDNIVFFKQAMLPVVNNQGKILLTKKHLVALAPGGTGGIYKALVTAGITKRMKEKNIEMLNYIHVDNPLVGMLDEAFIGHHIQDEAQISNKAIEKGYPEEKVSVYVTKGDNVSLVEYIHLPEKLAYQRDKNNRLTYRAGNIGVHVINREFIDHIANDIEFNYIKAHKRVDYIDVNGDFVTPLEPNAYKFECFVFDALPFAEKTATVLVKREDEFAPVKNAQGKDSPDSAHNMMNAKAKSWLEAAGINKDVISRLEAVEISGSIATDKETFVKKVGPMAEKISKQLKGQKKAYFD